MKHRIIQEKGKWAYVVEDGFGKEVSRKNVKDQKAAEEARTAAFAPPEAEDTGEAEKPARKARRPAGERADVKVEPTREQVTEADLPGETTTTAQVPASDEKRRQPATEEIASDKGRAPPPVREVARPLARSRTSRSQA